MLRTILILLATLIALPFVAFYYDQPLAPEHWATLQSLFKIMLGVALGCFVVSELTGNCSQVDKLWSIVPIVYVWFVASESTGYWLSSNPGSFFSERVLLMACLVTIWGLRLTFNFGRRGGYHWIPWRGEEDYRWSVLRQNPMLNGRISWALFNLFFISIYQHSLILLFTLPIVVAWQGGSTPLNLLDYLATALFLGFVLIETIADQQQWNFQKEKYRRIAAGEPLGEVYGQGFCSTGLWARVRHPNYASEQMIWLSFYLFSVAATGRWLNWSLAGAVLLMLLFLGSSDFSEKITLGKYPGYAGYQKRVGRFLPKLF
jgi:steroid 5-alpha reductase family enzyme